MEELIRNIPVAIVTTAVIVFMAIGAGKEVKAAQAEKEEPVTVEAELPVAGISAVLAEEIKALEPEEKEMPTLMEEPEPEPIKADRDNAEQYMLAKLMMAEAEGESVKGKALVARVVINRLESDDFPDTIPEVISQPGAFSVISGGRYDRVEPSEECWEALEMILNGWDESEGALFFEKSSNKGTWQQRNRPKLFTYGGHTFYE